MTTTFILRLLDAERRVLGWSKVPVESRGDGCLWATQGFVAEADTDGLGVAVNLHWPEVHVYHTAGLAVPIAVQAGEVFHIPLTDPVLRLTSEGLPLPPVTVRSSVTVGVGSAKR